MRLSDALRLTPSSTGRMLRTKLRSSLTCVRQRFCNCRNSSEAASTSRASSFLTISRRIWKLMKLCSGPS